MFLGTSISEAFGKDFERVLGGQNPWFSLFCRWFFEVIFGARIERSKNRKKLPTRELGEFFGGGSVSWRHGFGKAKKGVQQESVTVPHAQRPPLADAADLNGSAMPPTPIVRSFVRTFVRSFVRSFFRFFDRPFTPRGWLRSAWNFAKTRFRRFSTFDFSTAKKLFLWNFRIKKSGSNEKSLVLEKLGFFERYHQILHEKWPHFPRRSSLYVPWWRGSETIFNFFGWFLAQNWFTGQCIFSSRMMIWW